MLERTKENNGVHGDIVQYGMRKILIYPDSVLRQKSVEVGKVDDNLVKDVEEVRSMLMGKDNGAGLAAPQVGILKRFFVTKELKTRQPLVVINPKIVKTYGEKEFPMMRNNNDEWENFYEGCLSFPGIWGTAKRFLKIEVVWDGIEDGRLVKVKRHFEGFEAIVFQHETDHLDGVLFVDRIDESRGKVYWQKGEEMEEINLVSVEDILQRRN